MFMLVLVWWVCCSVVLSCCRVLCVLTGLMCVGRFVLFVGSCVFSGLCVRCSVCCVLCSVSRRRHLTMDEHFVAQQRFSYGRFSLELRCRATPELMPSMSFPAPGRRHMRCLSLRVCKVLSCSLQLSNTLYKEGRAFSSIYRCHAPVHLCRFPMQSMIFSHSDVSRVSSCLSLSHSDLCVVCCVFSVACFVLCWFLCHHMRFVCWCC